MLDGRGYRAAWIVERRAEPALHHMLLVEEIADIEMEVGVLVYRVIKCGIGSIRAVQRGYSGGLGAHS